MAAPEPSVPIEGATEPVPPPSLLGTPPSTEAPRRPREESDGISGKVLRYASKLVARYDADLDGRLQEAEWRRMAGTPRLADLDGDGTLTVQELAQRVATYSRQRTLRLMPARRAGDQPDELAEGTAQSTENAPATDADAELDVSAADEETGEMEANRAAGRERRRPSKPFHVSAARLPKGTPDWFTKRDRNGDGQVSMVEFASKWSQTEALEFARHDTNGDGIITAEECVAGSGNRATREPPAGTDANDAGAPPDNTSETAAAP